MSHLDYPVQVRRSGEKMGNVESGRTCQMVPKLSAIQMHRDLVAVGGDFVIKQMITVTVLGVLTTGW